MKGKPTPKQAVFLCCNRPEVFFGGAAGGGKSNALLYAALQYVDMPQYSALILRKTYTNLALPGAIMDRAYSWLHRSSAKWNSQEHSWTFRSGAVLTFGYLETENDKYRYASAEYQFIGIDEVTEIKESQYTFLASRLRKLEGSPIPLRLRCTGNPVGPGVKWVYNRFVKATHPDRVFIPSTMADNPHLDHDSYEKSLSLLDPVTRKRLRDGDWMIQDAGGMFRREKFRTCRSHEAPPDLDRVRCWDFASTEVTESNPDPDWSCGVLMGYKDGRFWVLDVQRDRLRPQAVEDLVRETAHRDGYDVPVYLEQEPGSSGKMAVDHYQRYVLPGYSVYGVPATGNKVTRARPWSAAVDAGNVTLVEADWTEDYIDEHCLFPEAEHDDQVDPSANAHFQLSNLVIGM
jgi:predicted phage terminase large subunit-like protein